MGHFAVHSVDRRVDKASKSVAVEGNGYDALECNWGVVGSVRLVYAALINPAVIDGEVG